MRISDWSSDVCSSDLPFVDFYEAYAQYQADVAAWDAKYAPPAVMTTPTPTVSPIGPVDPATTGTTSAETATTAAPLVDRSEEHTSELQSLMRISYAVFCSKKQKTTYTQHYTKTIVT